MRHPIVVMKILDPISGLGEGGYGLQAELLSRIAIYDNDVGQRCSH